VPSAATAAQAVDKRTATRKARNTLGKRQKAGIKGTVATPGPAPATTAPAATVTAKPPGAQSA
jgi:hypothetical protein